MLSRNIIGPECFVGTDAETFLRNYEISPVSSKPLVPHWVAQSFGLKSKFCLQFFTFKKKKRFKKLRLAENAFNFVDNLSDSSNLDEKFLSKHCINSSAHSPNEFALDWQLQTLENFAIQLEWKWTRMTGIRQFHD
jgi:hypothetical protein